MQPTQIITDAKPQVLPAGVVVGQVRRFGSRGVPYEVISVLSPQDIRIRVLTTGEEATYSVVDLLADPED